MKKCPECDRETDKYGIICEYCGKVEETRVKKEKESKSCSSAAQGGFKHE